jgi:tetratricopeptide (TPR) repeat protein
MTREKLPDINEPVEILTDDLPSATQKPAATQAEVPGPRRLELSIDLEPESRPAAAPSQRTAAESRESARRLFEVKEIEYNPRRPFYLTLIALGVAGAAYGGYVWWQLQPRYAYNAQAVRDSKAKTSAEKVPVAVTATMSPPLSAAVPSIPATSPAQSAVAPQAPPRPRPVETPVAPVARQATVPRQASPGAPSVAAARPASEQGGPASHTITISPASMQVDPQLERAYDAMQKNDLAGAREIYQGLLQRDLNHRDALLGMAAIDVKTRNYEMAEARYLRLLESDPRDAFAQAGLLALRGQMDPVASESRVKNLLATQPESAQLYFTLGNQYALQSRWSEAQQAYFRASAADPENSDYAFNLAVSLDHLRQKAQAVEFYRRSLALADRRPGSFDRALAAARIQQLQK